jgi:hypothetical protein
LPLPEWTSLATNTFDANGRFAITNPAAAARQFYLLQLP